MDDTIQYLNTDLVLISQDDITGLADVLGSLGVRALYVGLGGEDLWYGTFETDDHHTDPELNIAAMAAVVESLHAKDRAAWDRCQTREFNIGYDCGSKPWAFNQGLSKELLSRIAAIGASFRITLYPDRTPSSANSLPPHSGER